MKLTQYMVYESSASAAQKGRKITDMIMGRLWNWLNKRNFVVSNDDLVRVLNQMSPKDISFKLEKHKRNLGRYVSYGWFNFTPSIRDKIDTEIMLHISHKTDDYFRRFARPDKKDMFFDIRKNMFYKELYELLSHELTHELQALESSANIRWDWDKMDSTYLSAHGEIDAFALQAALQIINGDRSSIWDIYSSFHAKGSISDKVYNKFMKKVYKNIKELQRLGMTK